MGRGGIKCVRKHVTRTSLCSARVKKGVWGFSLRNLDRLRLLPQQSGTYFHLVQFDLMTTLQGVTIDGLIP